MEYEASPVNQHSFKEISDKADGTLPTKPFMPVIMLPWKSKDVKICFSIQLHILESCSCIGNTCFACPL